MKRRSLDLPLHRGKCPAWLFERMRKLSLLIGEVIIIEKGTKFFLERLSDPFWFQAFGCVLGFDWHSSGLTTTVCGALKEASRDLASYGFYVCGGKGRVSRNTPSEIEELSQITGVKAQPLKYASRMSAKVDSSALQDGFTLYHHSFIFNKEGDWCVIQQGMREDRNCCWARRYHWYGGDLTFFVRAPHKGIISEGSFLTLNMVDREKDNLRSLVTSLSQKKFQANLKDIELLKKEVPRLPYRHRVLLEDINPRRLERILLKTYERRPQDFESLLGIEGVGPKTVRALALIAELIYGESLSFKDPARFSFAHGGKDGYPYRINLREYQNTIEILRRCVEKAKIEFSEKRRALRRLFDFYKVEKLRK